MDNCWDYNRGASEIRMGKALRDGSREKVFLMSKIDGRTKDSAALQIDESLQRLQTDRIDLMQFHEIIRMEDPDRIFTDGGAIEAMQAAQQAGKIRYIGFTGHKDPLVHLRMLEIAGQSQVSLRCRADALERHGRALSELRAPGASLAAKRRDRGASDEGIWRSFHSPQQHRGAGRMSPLRAEPASLDSDHRHRLGSGS